MEIEQGACPACGGTAGMRLRSHECVAMGEGIRQALVRCERCGIVFTTPRLTRSAMDSLFSSEYQFYRRTAAEATPDPSRLERCVRPFVGRARRLTQIAGGPGRLLDLGCGDGYFLAAATRLGWTCSGVERNEASVAHARALGHDVRVGSIESAAEVATGAFDAVTMWGVLQLAYDPASALTSARSLLAKGGLLALGLSNFESLDRRLFRGRWWGLGLPRHLYHFDTHSIQRLLTQCGFRIVRIALDAPEWVAVENANTLLGIRMRPSGVQRVMRLAVKTSLRALYLVTRRTRFAPVMEIYAAPDLLE